MMILLFSEAQILYAQFFEGTIYYTIDVHYKGDNERHKTYYETEKFGDTVLVHVNNEGFLRRDFPGSSADFGVESYIYHPTENKQYATYRFTDTVYWYVSDSNYATDFSILPNCNVETESFNGRTLSCIETTSVDPFSGLPMKSRYFYIPGMYLINYSAWSNNEDFRQGFIYEMARSNMVKIYLDYGNYEYTMTAIRFEEKQIDDSVFMLSPDREFKKQ
ncbi:MAG: hypothetical protein AAFY36_18015 [Bacteroidota bacterium]